MWAQRPHLANEVQPEAKIWISARCWHLQMLNQMAPMSRGPRNVSVSQCLTPAFPRLVSRREPVQNSLPCACFREEFLNIILRLSLWVWYSVPAVLTLDMKCYIKAKEVSQVRLMWARRWILRVCIYHQSARTTSSALGSNVAFGERIFLNLQAGALGKATKSKASGKIKDSKKIIESVGEFRILRHGPPPRRTEVYLEQACYEPGTETEWASTQTPVFPPGMKMFKWHFGRNRLAFSKTWKGLFGKHVVEITGFVHAEVE